MEPIKAPKLIDKGILVYVPPSGSSCLISIEIQYSEKNPKYAWTGFESSLGIVWKDEKYESPQGDIFAFRGGLQLGFYIIKLKKLTPEGNIKEGQLTIGLIKPTPYLIIGVPYSIYPPILLT